MKTVVVVIMGIIFALCAGVSMGDDKVPQEGKGLSGKKAVVLSKIVDYDSDYDEVVTKENTVTVKDTERHSKKTSQYSADEINTEVIQ